MDGKLRNMTSIYLSDNNNNLLLLYRIGSKAIKLFGPKLSGLLLVKVS